MKKFAAIAAVSAILISCLCVGASAKLLTDSDPVYKYTGIVQNIPYYASASPVGVPLYSIEVSRGGSVIYTGSWDSDIYLLRNSGNPQYLREPEFYQLVDGETVGIFTAADILASDTIVFYSHSSSLTGFADPEVVVSAASVPALGNSIFTVGTSLVSFVMNSWITLVAVVAFVLVLAFGSIRKLIKGV